MGFNFGLICVRATDAAVTQDRVVEIIDAYWIERGATRRSKGFLKVDPMTLEDGGDELSFAVSPVTAAWIAIADSERYNACQPLAQHLSRELATEVIWFEICDAANAASYARYVSGEQVATEGEDEDASGYSATMDFLDGAALPYFGLYFDQMSKREWAENGFRTFGYRDVSDDDYYGGGGDDDEPEETPEQVAAREAEQLAETTRTADAAWALFAELAAAPDAETRDLDRVFRAASSARLDAHSWHGDLDDLAGLLREARHFDRLIELADLLERHDPRTARDDDTRRLRADGLLGLARFDEATPHVLHVLFAHANTRGSYDRLAYLYAQTGRRKLAQELAAARHALDDVLYSSSRDMWPSTALEAAAQDVDAARTTVARTLRDELEGVPLDDHARNRLDDFVELAGKLGDPPALAPLAQRVADEIARRDAAWKRVESAAGKSRAKVRRALAELPVGDRARELCDLGTGGAKRRPPYDDPGGVGRTPRPRVVPDGAGDDGIAFELAHHAVRGGHDAALGALFEAALALGEAATVAPWLPVARRRARVDARLYHPIAAVALAIGQRDLALAMCRAALDHVCPTFFDEMRDDAALAALRDDPAFTALFAEALTRPIVTRDDLEPKRVLVREHFIVAFFIPGSLSRLAEKLAPKLKRAIVSFFELVPDGAITHGLVGVHATRGEDTRPCDEKFLDRVRKQLDPARLASNGDAHIEMWGPGEDDEAFYLEIGGDADEDDANHVEMRFPPELVEELGLDAFRTWVETLSTQLPYTYGFATRALSPASYYSSDATMHGHMAALARWHAGLDAVEMVELRLWLEDKVPGAKWLSFLDGKKLRRLGGLDHLARMLAPHGVRVAALPNGAVVQAGAAPDRGRGGEFANREQLRHVHAALAPIAKLDWNLNGGLDAYPGGVEAWLRRYVDDLVIPPPTNPILIARPPRPGV